MKWCRVRAEGRPAWGLVEGDVVEVESPAIGVLRNPVVAYSAAGGAR
ncbi:MAG TPA: Rv2993c-like domain-containing protein [Methylomirabilota bacterium]|nr:Rv2993c-like domain-containing protein [Methylomirabilota bacterium]